VRNKEKKASAKTKKQEQIREHENSGKTIIKLQNVPKISQMEGRSRM
jgi:hypothetical protein